ncbi:CAAX amino protease [Sphaerisporangium siamense]|uniref:Membrane protease YdiL (CAAX protease family) n=1 Tax=Sphaerisporangium siamense TaxID=795645 RepID=A0A7W7G7U3_9ACTN|nr:type II CAAX endopeptidase family protein [Sphaerisporangium siamense]MBB4701003.1 membrane protease YdiL (CAAX protease family) [Sphaerisporangium siamense]GII85852.1 CAAX amino protease [Sphaerisporangium siamense]
MYDPSQQRPPAGEPGGGAYFPGPPPWQAPPGPEPWAVPVAPGTRYDHMARTPVNRWWRPLVGTVVIAAAFVGVAVVVLLGGTIVAQLSGVPMLVDGATFGDPVLELSVMLLSIALVLPFVFGAAWLVQRRPPGTLSSVAGRLRWGWLLICLLVALGAVILGQVAMALTYAATGEGVGELFGWVGWERFLPALLVVVVLVPFQAATEEYVFRGWVLQGFGAYFRNPWPGILLGAAMFTSLHAYTDWGIVDVFSFGVLMGWMAVRTGGLEAPIALHVVNNVVSFLPPAASGDLGDALRQGTVPWQAISGTVVQLGFFAVVTLIIAHKRAIQTVSR